MSTTKTRISSAEEFMEIATDQPWEVWEGELREVPGAGGTASRLAVTIILLIGRFAKLRELGMMTGADGTYILSYSPLTIVVPDVAFVRWDRLPDHISPDSYIPVPPDLAIEVRSPTDSNRDIEEKLVRYRKAGVPLVWWVDPKRKTVAVHRNGILSAELSADDTLDGGDILPGLSFSVSEIFD